jgi:glycerol kinase
MFNPGLFAPHWKDDARGTIVGMTQFTTKDHICRATLEAVSYQTKDIMDSMVTDTGSPISLLRVDGGMSMSDSLMQIQADIADVKLIRPCMLETTAFGAALAAGHAIGVWKDLGALHNEDTVTTFVPQITKEKQDELHNGWKRAVEKSIGWVQ